MLTSAFALHVYASTNWHNTGYIRESVDSLCRDERDLLGHKQKACYLPNTVFLSLFRYLYPWPLSVSVSNNTHKLAQIHRQMCTQKSAKPPSSRLLFLFRPTAKLGKHRNRPNLHLPGFFFFSDLLQSWGNYRPWFLHNDA